MQIARGMRAAVTAAKLPPAVFYDLSVSGDGNPRNYGCQETRFAPLAIVITGIAPASEYPIPNALHLESRVCLVCERHNIHAEARTVPDFSRNASTAKRTRISTAINNLRRSYGWLLANAGAGLSIIANALGHADTRMTKRHYAHLLDSVVAAELQAKLPIFRTRSSRKAAA